MTSDDISLMLPALVAMIGGLVLLGWSASRFIDGAAATALHLRIPALLVGMVVIGFGTSAPELLIALLSALQGSPALAMGNAYGSNISNIGLILGLTALIKPISVHSLVLRRELPLLCLATALAVWLLLDGQMSRADGVILLAAFSALMAWSIIQGLRSQDDVLGVEVAQQLDAHPMSLRAALAWLTAGLIMLIISSRMLVWGAVQTAQLLGVSDLIIGLSIVAIGTSLPELASVMAAVGKGEHDLAMGNVLGSNLFNTLAVVGVAAVVCPMDTPLELLNRDGAVMGAMTVSLFLLGYGFGKRTGRINRFEGAGLLLAYLAYLVLLTMSAFGGRGPGI